MHNKLYKIAAMLLMASALTLLSCEKWGNEPYTPSNPQQELVAQTFKMTLKTDVSPLDKSTKAWVPAAWVFNYSTIPANLVLTGTGASAGNNYTKSCTVAELKAGTVTFAMLPGTYTATFLTPHIWTADVWALNGFTVAQLDGGTFAPKMGDVLDIAINNTGLVVTGATPIALTATCEDALIVVDIPSVTAVKASKEDTFAPTYLPRLLKDIPNAFHYGYLNVTPLYIKIINGVETVVNCSSYLKGHAYHILANISQSETLNIPGMITHDVVLP